MFFRKILSKPNEYPVKRVELNIDYKIENGKFYIKRGKLYTENETFYIDNDKMPLSQKKILYGKYTKYKNDLNEKRIKTTNDSLETLKMSYGKSSLRDSKINDILNG